MCSGMPQFTKAFNLALAATALICFAPPTQAQTQEQVASQLIKAGGLLSRDDDGNVVDIDLDIGADKDIESIDFRVFSKLQIIMISAHRAHDLTDRPLAHLRKTIAPGLTHLAILGARTSEKELPLLLKKQSSLTSLHLDGTTVTDRVLPAIGQLRSLTHLGLSQTKITDEGLKTLSDLQELEILDVGWTKISDIGLVEIKKMRKLYWLRADGTKVTDVGIQGLANLPELHHLGVSFTKVTEKGRNDLKKVLPELNFMKSR